MIQIGVVAHIKREHLIDKLIQRCTPDVVRFDDGQPSVSGAADNHIRVLRYLSASKLASEWSVVLEDDAMPVPDFRSQLEIALPASGSPLVGLYLGTSRLGAVTQQAISTAVKSCATWRANWIRADWFISTVGYAIKTSCLDSLIHHLDADGGPVDVRINGWTHKSRIETWYTQPSLVDHLDEQSLISSVGVQFPRHAWSFGARSQWRKDSVRMARVDGWSPQR